MNLWPFIFLTAYGFVFIFQKIFVLDNNMHGDMFVILNLAGLHMQMPPKLVTRELRLSWEDDGNGAARVSVGKESEPPRRAPSITLSCNSPS